MTLTGVVNNSNYMTDETLTSSNITGMANNGISEVNAKAKTKLPFFEDTVTDYWAIPDFWVLRLLEPYLSFSIMANDGDTNPRDFHYNRFLAALNDFIKNGLGDIAEFYPEGSDNAGEPTGFAGKSDRMKEINTINRRVSGWW